MLTKIDTIWLQGDLTDDQRTELTALAREKAISGTAMRLFKDSWITSM